MSNWFKDEQLKSIAITKPDGEVIAYIPNDSEGETIQAPDVLIRFNYGEEYKFIDKSGKIFIQDEDKNKTAKTILMESVEKALNKKKIEKALDIKLYPWQIEYIFLDDTSKVPPDRRVGKTLAYCIKLALSEGEAIRVHNIEEYCDSPGTMRYAHGYFKGHFMQIRERLEEAGLKVRDIKY